MQILRLTTSADTELNTDDELKLDLSLQDKDSQIKLEGKIYKDVENIPSEDELVEKDQKLEKPPKN